jgi:hypothetical protein
MAEVTIPPDARRLIPTFYGFFYFYCPLSITQNFRNRIEFGYHSLNVGLGQAARNVVAFATGTSNDQAKENIMISKDSETVEIDAYLLGDGRYIQKTNLILLYELQISLINRKYNKEVALSLVSAGFVPPTLLADPGLLLRLTSFLVSDIAIGFHYYIESINFNVRSEIDEAIRFKITLQRYYNYDLIGAVALLTISLAQTIFASMSPSAEKTMFAEPYVSTSNEVTDNANRSV